MRNRKINPLRAFAIATTTALALAACSPAGTGEVPEEGQADAAEDGDGAEGPDVEDPEGEAGSGEDGGIVQIVTHDSFDLPAELLEQFTHETGYEVSFAAPGDAGALVNQLILTKDSPLGDVVYGIDNSFAARAAGAGILAPFEPTNLPENAGQYLVDGAGLAPIDVGDVCLNVDLDWFEAEGIEPPVTLQDIASDEYAGLTILTNPAQSSPGLAFMLATISEFDDGWVDYWRDLLGGGVKIVDSWSDAYYTDFTANGGSRPVVLSYSTSPAFTIDDAGESTTASLLETCFRQIEYAAVLEGAANPAGAEAFVEFLLSDAVQAAIPEAMFMYPVAPVELPEEWAAHAPLATTPRQVDPAEIETNLDDWLHTFRDDVIG